jgi:hypothetical protein
MFKIALAWKHRWNLQNNLFYISKISVAETRCRMKPSSYYALIYVAVCIIQHGIVNNSFWYNSITQREEQTGYAIYFT